MDLLGDVLSVSGVCGAVGARIEAGQDWGWWWASPTPRAALHAVTSGTAWIGLPGREPLQLMPGDAVLLPDGAEHALGSDAEALARTTALHFDPWHTTGTGALRIGAGPVLARILCADYGHDAGTSTQVLGLLPPLVHIRARSDGGPLEDTLRLLGRELADPGMASGVILDRLVDVLLVQVLRTWLASAPGGEPSWLGALRDEVVGAAVARLHEDPARPWTTSILAREVGVSRATLTRRFATATGESPGAYLGRWRMDVAARRLRDSSDSLETIARSVGYTSVYAFNRAFSRSRSESPGRYRHRTAGR
jgi:AraC-like DNA-binding protein/quercetin dioxygenase-like cupin family protein